MRFTKFMEDSVVAPPNSRHETPTYRVSDQGGHAKDQGQAWNETLLSADSQRSRKLPCVVLCSAQCASFGRM
jgi:hypothetical protein